MFLVVEELILWFDLFNESDDEIYDLCCYFYFVCGVGGDRSLVELICYSDGFVMEWDDCCVGWLLGIDYVGFCCYIDEEENMFFRYEEMVIII